MAKVTVDALVAEGIDEAFEVNPKGAEAINRKIAQLALIPPQTLERFTVNDLRNMATGVIPKVRVKKPELIAKLREVIVAQREVIVMQAAVYMEKLADSNVDGEDVIRMIGTVGPEEAAKLLHESLLKRMLPLSIAKHVTTNIRKLMRTSDLPLPKIESFDTVWRELIKPAIEENNQAYRERVQEKRIDQRVIYVEPVITFAQQALAKLVEWTEGKTDEQIQMQRIHNWQGVVYAVAISTGRRPSEIMSIHTTFTPAADEHISYEGLAKSGVRAGSSADYVAKAKECTAPSVCPVAHVMEGLRYLELLEKRKDIAHDDVNNLYGKQLSARVPENIRAALREMGIQKLYDCRHFYANYWKRLHERSQRKTMDSGKYLEIIMGHSDSRVTESYNDVAVWFPEDCESAEETSEQVAQD